MAIPADAPAMLEPVAPDRIERAAVHGAVGWMGLCALLALSAALLGLDQRFAAGGLALALLPGMVTLALAPRLHRPWAQAAAVFAWVGFGVVGAGLTGGMASPMAACFLIGPTLAHVAGRPRLAAEAAVFGLIGLLTAAAASRAGNAVVYVAPLPWMAAAAAVALAAFWLAHRGGGGDRAAAALALVGPDGRLREATPAALRRLGLHAGAAPGAALPEAMGDRLDAEDRAALTEALKEAAGGRATALDVIVRGRDPGEDDRGLALEIAPQDGGLALTAVDATRWMEHVGRLQLDLEETRRLAAERAQRTAELSHELRTPLAHINGFAEIMRRQLYGALAPKYVEYAELIQKSGGNLLELITGLMDLSRVEGGAYPIEKERFDARDLVQEVVRLAAEAAAAKGVGLAAEAPAGPLMLSADPRAVRQILTNLCTNALKFTPAGGRVRMIARGEGGMVVLEAADTGPGISAAEKSQLGAAYTRGAAAKGVEGVGLGLALVRGFAELHGGRLSFHDNPGGGAIVRVALPAEG